MTIKIILYKVEDCQKRKILNLIKRLHNFRKRYKKNIKNNT